jgi:Tfp pilus assembly protein PilE
MNKRKRGISLAELLVVLTISAIIIIGALVIYNIGWQSYNISTKKAEIQRSMLNAYEIISEYTRFATEVSLSNDISSISSSNTSHRVFYVNDDNILVTYLLDNQSNESFLTDPFMNNIEFGYENNVLNIYMESLPLKSNDPTSAATILTKIKMLNIKKDETESGTGTLLIIRHFDENKQDKNQ